MVQLLCYLYFFLLFILGTISVGTFSDSYPSSAMYTKYIISSRQLTLHLSSDARCLDRGLICSKLFRLASFPYFMRRLYFSFSLSVLSFSSPELVRARFLRLDRLCPNLSRRFRSFPVQTWSHMKQIVSITRRTAASMQIVRWSWYNLVILHWKLHFFLKYCIIYRWI